MRPNTGNPVQEARRSRHFSGFLIDNITFITVTLNIMTVAQTRHFLLKSVMALHAVRLLIFRVLYLVVFRSDMTVPAVSVFSRVDQR